MSNCNFNIPFSGDPSPLIAKAKAAVESQNGSFDGDNTQGNFEVTVMANTIQGSYNVAGQIMNITIFNKPFFVPCSTIEGFLKSKMT
ncbi:MAG: hypothetical protein ABI683_07415 [Ginsengibacter sp.]